MILIALFAVLGVTLPLVAVASIVAAIWLGAVLIGAGGIALAAWGLMAEAAAQVHDHWQDDVTELGLSRDRRAELRRAAGQALRRSAAITDWDQLAASART